MVIEPTKSSSTFFNEINTGQKERSSSVHPTRSALDAAVHYNRLGNDQSKQHLSLVRFSILHEDTDGQQFDQFVQQF